MIFHDVPTYQSSRNRSPFARSDFIAWRRSSSRLRGKAGKVGKAPPLEGGAEGVFPAVASTGW